MSIRTVNLFAPNTESFTLRNLLAVMSGRPGSPISGLAEAPDFYTGLSIRQWGTGTRSAALTAPARTETQSISYDVTKVFTRVPRLSLISGPGSTLIAYPPSDIFPVSDPGDGECVLGVDTALQHGIGFPYLSRHYLSTSFYAVEGGANAGTYTIDYDDPGTDDESGAITGDLLFETWSWEYSASHSGDGGDPFDELWVPFQSPLAGSPQDWWKIPATDFTNWRDVRGTYTASIADSDLDGSSDTNDVKHYVTLEILGQPDLDFQTAGASQYAPQL